MNGDAEIEQYETEGGTIVIYDAENPESWVRSEEPLTLKEMR